MSIAQRTATTTWEGAAPTIVSSHLLVKASKPCSNRADHTRRHTPRTATECR
jgi:hypothetical protein